MGNPEKSDFEKIIMFSRRADRDNEYFGCVSVWTDDLGVTFSYVYTNLFTRFWLESGMVCTFLSLSHPEASNL